MELLVACRACFCSERRLYKFDEHSLHKYFLAILGLDCTQLDELPQYLCYECAWLVTKLYHFREKCLRAQVSYVTMLQSENEVKLSNIKQLHGQNISKISFNLKPPNVFTYTHQEIEQKSDKCETDALTMTAELDIKEDSEIKEEKVNDFGDTTLLYVSNDKNNIIVDANHVFTRGLTDFGDSDDDYDDEISDEERVAVTLSPIQESGSSDNEEPDDVIVDKKIAELKKKLFKNRKPPESSRTPRLTIVKIKQQLQALRTARENAMRQVSENEQNKTKRITPKMAAIAARMAKEENAMKEYVTIVTLSPQEQLAEIVARQHSSNYKNSPLKCELCYKGFLDNVTFQNHILKHQPSAGDAECAVCKLRFKTRCKLRNHSRAHNKKYHCKSCPFVSTAMYKAKQHQKWHKGFTYECKHCGEVSTKWTTYLSHLRIKHPSEFICSVCGYSFVSKLGLNQHKAMMHKDQVKECRESAPTEPGPGRYCAECSMQFVSLEAYNRHMANSSKHVNITVCRECGITFDTGEELRLHRRKMHCKKGSKRYGNKTKSTVWPRKCTHCSEEIANAHCLWFHFRRKHPDQKYSVPHQHICEICGKGFTSTTILRYHRLTHFEERSYKCLECPKSFHNPTGLQMHMRSHSDLRPYSCDVCSKAFKSKMALERHYRIHTGVKPYSCDLCGKEFTQSDSRNMHVRTVHHKQPVLYSKEQLERRRQRARARAAARKAAADRGLGPAPPHVKPPPTEGSGPRRRT